MIDVDAIAQQLGPAVAARGLELYDVELSGSGRARVLRVLVDRDGGVDLDAIAEATQAISPLLDEPPLDAVISGPYALEVSSPGVERPLRRPAQYVRAVGETVSVKVSGSDEHGPRRVRGVVASADDTGVELTFDGATERFRYDEITQARTVFEWGEESRRTEKSKPTPKREPVRR
jgi:ribosome maturation factor RimP